MRYMNRMDGKSGRNYITRYYDAKDAMDADFALMAENEEFATAIKDESLFFVESYERDSGEYTMTRRETLVPPER